MEKIKRNVLLNPGPATTTDTVKMAQVVPDICPREKEFAGLMKGLRSDLLKVVHAPEDEYTSVLFCGSGTINIDVCINSLVPEGKKILVVNNGAYNSRAVEVCEMYHIPHINLKSSVYEQPKLDDIETGGVKEAAQSQWGRIFADSVSGSINLVGWRTPQKELLTPNKRFMFKSDDNFFYKETELLIRSVKLNKNASSVTSSIDVVFPDAYTKKQIEVLPWA